MEVSLRVSGLAPGLKRRLGTRQTLVTCSGTGISYAGGFFETDAPHALPLNRGESNRGAVSKFPILYLGSLFQSPFLFPKSGPPPLRLRLIVSSDGVPLISFVPSHCSRTSQQVGVFGYF